MRQERPGSLVAQIFKLSLPQGQRFTNSEQVDACLLLECFNPESTLSPSPMQCAPITPRGFSLVLQRSKDKGGLGKFFVFFPSQETTLSRCTLIVECYYPRRVWSSTFRVGRPKRFSFSGSLVHLL